MGIRIKDVSNGGGHCGTIVTGDVRKLDAEGLSLTTGRFMMNEDSLRTGMDDYRAHIDVISGNGPFGRMETNAFAHRFEDLRFELVWNA